jgi:Flp pilus assembly protein TadG
MIPAVIGVGGRSGTRAITPAGIAGRDGTSAPGQEDGFATLELLVFAVFLISMVLLVVGLGRISHGRDLVAQAAAAGARASSLSFSPAGATEAGQRAATDTLSEAGRSCTAQSAEVDTSDFRPGGQVVVRVRCTVDLSAVLFPGLPGSMTLRSQASAPVDSYRDLGNTP